VDGDAPITADPVKLAQAVGAVVVALRRELVTSDRLSVEGRRTRGNGADAYEVLVGDAAAGAGATFDEWRGGVGLSLINARRILNAHGGAIFAPPDGSKASARIVLPIGTAK